MHKISHDILLIQALDADAHLKFSSYTGQWYVSANVEVGGNGGLSGLIQHAETPEDAVEAFLEFAQLISSPEYLVTDAFRSTRQHWRWNGASFARIFTPERVKS